MQPEYDQPVADYVRYFADKKGDSIAYLDGDVSCSYSELDRRASQVANGLVADGCQEADRIGYLGVNSSAYVEVFFGSNKAKTIYVGLNWRLTPVELEYVLNDAGIKAIFCDQQFVPMLEELRAKVPSLQLILSVGSEGNYPAWRDSQDRTDPQLSHDPEDAIVQFYTSGTTGKPKGVQLTNKSMSAHRWAEDQMGDFYLNSDRDEIIINAMPNFHIGGLGWLLLSVFRGAKVILMAAPDPARFLDLTEQHKVTHLFAVPVVLGMMLAEQKKQARDLSSLQVFHYGASPIAPAMLKEAIEVMACDFVQYYGMTETNGTVSTLLPSDHDLTNPERLKSCGRALSGMEIKICDENGVELPRNTNGEIWVKSPAIMKQYWNRPEATAEAIVDGWYKSGDGARMDEDGYIYMADRIKDMIVTGGENVYPAEVESALFEHPAVAESSVIGTPDEKWGEAVTAVVVLAEGQKAESEELIAFLRDRLAGYKIPRKYQFVVELPRTPSGKVKKFELREQFA